MITSYILTTVATRQSRRRLHTTIEYTRVDAHTIVHHCTARPNAAARTVAARTAAARMVAARSAAARSAVARSMAARSAVARSMAARSGAWRP